MNKSVAAEPKLGEVRSALDEIVREGAQQLLRAALEAEVGDFVERYREIVDEQGRRRVVRNGYLPEREVLTGAGALQVRQPRARDLRDQGAGDSIRFSSSILPRYLRRSRNLDELIPWLFLGGVSTGNFQPALQAILGPEAKALSASVVTRLLKSWQAEHEVWSRRDLSDQEYVYVWADGIYFNIRLEEQRQCILVVLGATRDGRKELLGLVDGYRESEQSWHELLMDLKARGLKAAPKIAVGDGGLGFWKALRKVFPTTREQRCWVHKTANVLNKLPRAVQSRAKADLHQVWMAETRDDAHKALELFGAKYKAKYPKAVACLDQDRDVLLTFYDFPAEHWIHLRTTNPIESTFATVRLRHRRTKGSGSRAACLAMVFKLVVAASRGWRRLNCAAKLAQLLQGHQFIDGVLQERSAA